MGCLDHTWPTTDSPESTQSDGSAQTQLARAFGDRLASAVTVATTEHFNLQIARAATRAEANRAHLPRGAVHHLIAVAFIGQMSRSAGPSTPTNASTDKRISANAFLGARRSCGGCQRGSGGTERGFRVRSGERARRRPWPGAWYLGVSGRPPRPRAGRPRWVRTRPRERNSGPPRIPGAVLPQHPPRRRGAPAPRTCPESRRATATAPRSGMPRGQRRRRGGWPHEAVQRSARAPPVLEPD
jgi:hypothetical protein